MAEPVEVVAEPTPNPNAFKFTVNREVNAGRGQTFASPSEALPSPLAQWLFQVGGVRSLFFLKDFITVARRPEVDWDDIVPRVAALIRDFYETQA